MSSPFCDTLSYCSPAHGGWGIIRPCALIPDSYLLFVCPAACFRHGSLGAIQHGFKKRISFLYIDQSDIVNGYDQAILEGIDELLEKITLKVRVMFVYVSCLDDFIGTDMEKVLMKASKKHPEIMFRVGHMNPIASSTKLPPLVTTLDTMASILPEWEEKDDNISFFGNFVEIPEESDVIRFFKNNNIKARQLINCETFEEYLQMSKSRIALLTKPTYSYGVERLKKRVGIERFDMYVSYDVENIEKQYQQLGKLLNIDVKEWINECKVEAYKEIEDTLKKTGNIQVYVSDSATMFPFQTALALIKYGFNVTRVYAIQAAGADQPYMKQLMEEYPEVEIIQSDHPDMSIRQKQREAAIAIGEEAAYLTQSLHVVNLAEDEGMLGFYAVSRLMQMMSEAMDEVADIEKMIEEYGGIV